MHYREHEPPPALRPFVRCLWELEHDYGGPTSSRERLWATSHAELLVIRAGSYRHARGEALRGVVFMGPRTRPLTLVADQRVALVAARFQVGGAAGLLARPPREVVDVVANAADVGVPVAATSLAELGDRLEHALAHAVPDPVVAVASGIIEERGGRVAVPDLARAMGTTVRTLQRHFDRSAGMSPGTVARVARFNRVRELLVRDRGADLAELAAETGYADHAHLTRTFRERFDLSPREFRDLLRELTGTGVAPVQA